MRSDILKLYEDELHKTMRQMDLFQGRFAITSYMWTNGTQRKGYMAVTPHFIDDQWKVQKINF